VLKIEKARVQVLFEHLETFGSCLIINAAKRKNFDPRQVYELFIAPIDIEQFFRFLFARANAGRVDRV